MFNNSRSDFLSNHWSTVVSSCQQDLEPGDREQVSEIASWHDLQTAIWGNQSLTVPHQIALIKPTLAHARRFIEYFEVEAGYGTSAAFAWGILGLLLNVSEPSMFSFWIVR
jgi:hypothetical protein